MKPSQSCSISFLNPLNFNWKVRFWYALDRAVNPWKVHYSGGPYSLYFYPWYFPYQFSLMHDALKITKASRLGKVHQVQLKFPFWLMLDQGFEAYRR